MTDDVNSVCCAREVSRVLFIQRTAAKDKMEITLDLNLILLRKQFNILACTNGNVLPVLSSANIIFDLHIVHRKVGQRLELFRRMRHPEWSLIYQSAVCAPTAARVRGQVSGEGGRNSKQREH